MSCSPKIFVALDLTLYGKYDTSKSVQIRLTNQTALEQKTPIESYPALLSITGVGVQQDEFYPKNKTGTVVLNNTRDAIAFGKRISDLASTFAIQNAKATISIAVIPEDDEDVELDLQLIWEGRVSSVNYATNATITSQKLSLSLKSDEEEHIVTRVLRKEDFPDMPNRSKGKYLPIVFGFDQQVIPYPLEEPIQEGVNGTKMSCAYATNMETAVGNPFRNIGITKILAKDLSTEGEEYSQYKEVKSANDINTPVYQQVGSTVATVPDIANARAFWIPYFPDYATSESFIVTSIALQVQGNNSAATEIEGEVSIRIHRQQVNAQRPKQPSETLATAVVEKKDYLANWVGNSVFTIQAVFDKFVPIVGDGTYWISIQASGENEPENVTKLPIINANPGVVPGIVTHWKTTEAATKDNEDTWLEETAYPGQTTASFQLYGLVLGDFPDGDGSADEDGLGYSYTDLRYQDFFSTHPQGAQETDDLTRIDLIYEISGLKDVNGGITGVPNFILGNPVWQLYALLHTYNGVSWDAGPLNSLRFADSHDQYFNTNRPLFRETAGRSYGKVTNVDIIKEIGRNSYSTITYDGIGGPAEYSILAVGKKRYPTIFLNDNDFLMERWTVSNLSEVINALDLNYARRLDDIHFQSSLDQDQFRDYSKTFYTHSRDGGIGQQYSEKSYFHYGERRLNNENFDFINDDISAATVGELFLRLHDHPPEYAQVKIEYGAITNGIRMLDVVQLNSTELPSSYGTLPRVETEDDDCRLAGNPTAVTKSITGVVQAITLNYEQNGQVFFRYLVRLANQENDPMIEYFIAEDIDV